MQSGVTVQSVFEQKLENMRKFFDVEITESGKKAEIDAFTPERIVAELIATAPLWGLVESGDIHSIISILEVTKCATPEEQADLDRVVLILHKMPSERQKKLMDYFKYFLKLTKAWTQ